MIRTKEKYEQHFENARTHLITIANQYSDISFNSLQAYHEVMKNIKKHTSLNQFNAVSDIKEQLSLLIYPGFIIHTPRTWLEQLPRFLKGVEIRLQKLQQSLDVDQQRQRQLQPYWQELTRQRELDSSVFSTDPEWQLYRWMLEEMRISLFAQNLKTSVPVSIKRLDEQLAKVKQQ